MSDAPPASVTSAHPAAATSGETWPAVNQPSPPRPPVPRFPSVGSELRVTTVRNGFILASQDGAPLAVATDAHTLTQAILEWARGL